MSDTFKSIISQSKTILESARLEAEQIIEKARQLAKQEAEQIKDDALQKGCAEALSVLLEIKQNKDKILQQFSEQAWTVVLDIAKQVVGELINENYQAFIIQRVQQALEIFAIQNKVTLTVTEQDSQLLSGKLKRDGLILQVNNSLSAGIFEISIDDCKLVADVNKQLETIITNYTR